MALTPKQAIEEVREGQNKQRIQEDKLRFNVFQGQLRDEVLGFLRSEFLKPETIQAMQHRIVPINITQKIINKLAMVYRQAPMRSPVLENDGDQTLVDLYTDSFNLNEKMKSANRFFKLHKHTALEPFVDRDGVPRMRVLPSQTYTPLSDDPIQPERPTGFVKHVITDNQDPSKMRFHYWTDERFWILDGEGNMVGDEMSALDNAEGVNPFGKIPFIYVPENDDGRLIPISDDDLISMQFVICALLSDLTFASKYQAWSIYTLTGVDSTETVGMNPNSVLFLPEGASFNAVKADIDIDSMLAQVEAHVGLLLTTKNLSVGDITGDVSAASNAASGVAKMIDRSETTEDRMDQEAYFVNAERRLWELWAHDMLPVLVAANRIAPDWQGQFSPEFELAIEFPDQKPVVSDKELIEVELMKLDGGLTTKKRAMQSLFKDMSSEQVDALIAEIEEQKRSNVQAFMGGLVNANETAEEPETSAQPD